MDDKLNQLKNQWDREKAMLDTSKLQSSELVELAKKKKKGVLQSHYGNTIVLTMTLIMIATFFYYNTPFQTLLSKIGVGLMIGGLAIRIIIEIVSAQNFQQISVIDHALENTNSSLRFYRFRKKIHGWLTISIVALYTLGFYMLTPEFSKYISLTWMIIMDTSYVIGGIILVVQIRKGIKEEMNQMKELIAIRDEMDNG